MPGVSLTIDVGALYESHGDWLRKWLQRHTRCGHRAADLAQDTFCRVLETPGSAPLREPRSYLSALARRILIDDIRHREVERAYLAAHAAGSPNADALTPERIAEAAQLLDAIVKLLEALPDNVRRAFMMIRFDGLRYADAAAVLGVSDRMVKRYVAQAYAHCYAIAYSD
ncbi:sigma-70 family RNA polymerase sigma factor [Novosphingobium guangzhouense]|uniref:RNA polymerase subunit sigma-70 n=1 Tax=Novosphingobium guangzhouense TaxID=1850347 RepID=A0A2K2FWV0_9SPHN|nr:sigma-70 family RNA polymerase sigma factor [Novosphingobium guangzhouense]PNU03255.1 RNA polymerase subunit sigma-70 [Novosphingobium guangzhouense]